MAVEQSRSARAPAQAAGADRASTAAVVEDAAGVAPGQERRGAFLTALRVDLERMVTEEFTDTPYAGTGCPLIGFYLDHYQSASLGELTAAAVRTAGGGAADAAGLRLGVVSAAREAVRQWRRTGTMPPLPTWLPEPPSALARWLGLGGSAGTQRKADGGGPGRGTAPGGVLARLTTGQPLPGTQRSRLERAVGTPLGDVRVHTGPEAAAVTGEEHAHALTVGDHIAFAAGTWQPGTPFGDALLAHEAAHVAQQRGTGPAGPGAEHEADLGAAGFLTGRPRPPAGAGGGLRLQRCGGSGPEFDWRGAARTEVTGAADRIRQLQAELDRISAGDMTPATAQRIGEIQKELMAEVQRLRAAGIRLDMIAMLRKIQAGEDLLKVTGRIDGTEPTRVPFGERRQLRLLLDWMPQHTDVRTAWMLEVEGLSDAVPDGTPGTLFEKTLNDRFWAGYDHNARLVRRGSGVALPPVRVLVQVYTGSQARPESTIVAPWFEIVDVPPATSTIDSPRILSAAPPPATGPQPAATPQKDLVLQGATVPFQLSWAPPLGWSTGHGYRIAWAVSDPGKTLDQAALQRLAAGREGRRLPDEQNTVYEHRFRGTGDHVVYVVIQPGTATEAEERYEKAGNLPDTRTVLEHRAAGGFLVGTRPVQVVDVATMAGEQLARGSAQPPRAFGDFMGDLDQQITATTQAIEGGTLAPRELAAQKERLTEHRSAVQKNLGTAAAMLPFPATDAEFRTDATYVTPVPCAYAHPDIGGAQPLAVYVRVRAVGDDWEAVLIDATTSEILPRRGVGGSQAAAMRAALADWGANNDFPTGGQVAYRFDRWGITGGFSTTTTAKTLREWASSILSVVGLIVGVILLLLPEPTSKAGAYALLYGAAGGVAMAGMVGGILLGGYEIYRNLSLGRPLLSERNAIEALGILASVLGLRGTMLARSAGKAIQAGSAEIATLRQIRVGQRLVIASAAIDAGTFVEVTASALSQLQDMAHDESIPESERERRMLQTIGMLAVRGLLLVGSNRDLFGRMVAGRRQPGVIDARAARGEKVELDPFNKALIQIELRNLGLTPQQLAGLDDTVLVRLLGEVHQRMAAPGEAATLASAYGKGITKRQDTPLSPTNFKQALRPISVPLPPTAKYRFNAATATGTLVVTLPGGGKVTVDIVFLQYPNIGVSAPSAPHDRPGDARLAVKENGKGGYTATVYLHTDLSAADTSLLAGVELRELLETVRSYPGSGAPDFATHRAAQQRPAIFFSTTAATATTVPTAEDHSSAYMLRRLWQRSGMEGRAAATLPAGPVRDLDVALFELGFGRTGNHDEMVGALQGILGADASPSFVAFVRGYRARRMASAGTALADVLDNPVAGPDWNGLRTSLTTRGLSAPDAEAVVSRLAGTGRTPREAAHVASLPTARITELAGLGTRELGRILTLDPALLPDALALTPSPAALSAMLKQVDTPWVEAVLRQPIGSPNRALLGEMAADALAAPQRQLPTESWSETKTSQPQLEQILDLPASGFERMRHPTTGDLLSEPGFKNRRPLNRGREGRKLRDVTWPDIYGRRTATGQDEAMELKTVYLGESVASQFRKKETLERIETQHGGRIAHLPLNVPSYLVVDIRQSGQSIPQALQDLSAVLPQQMQGFWNGVRFITGTHGNPQLSGTYQIP
ncbi:eCIS core domain-containing protein [Actinoplanes subglobosus]|uniref:DUF4157 domain-containing protein n=1 Tax=Actinoplanes subglobosus TaxID=1547892 RepID=A0ABV8IPU8_9ACTN